MRSQLIESPLSLELYFPRGAVRKHDYSKLPHQDVVRHLAAAHLSLTNTGGSIKTRGTSKMYAGTVTLFADYLEKIQHKGSIAEITPKTFRGFIRAHRPINNNALRIMLDRVAELSLNALNSELREFVSVPIRQEVRKGKLVPPLSPSEAKALEEACRAEIAEVEARLSEGWRVAATGEDPAEHGFSDENLLYYLSLNGPTGVAGLAKYCGLSEPEFAEIIGKNCNKTRELNARLYPTLDDLVSYLLFIGLKSGISPEGIAWLHADGWERIGADKIRLNWFKARGGGNEADTFSAKGQWSVGGLLGRVRSVTEPARRHVAGDDQQYLWIVAKRRPVEAVFLTGWGKTVARFCERHNLQTIEGKPLVVDRRALRKTYYARLDRRYHGAIATIAGANQSAQVAADHYLAANTETDMISEVIENTQRTLVKRAEQAQHATVVTVDELSTLEADLTAAAQRLQVSEDKARQLITGTEEDVFAAKCKDFHNSPHGKPGEPCPAAVWECLFCPLAVITPSKLPNLLALLDHIDAAYERMQTSEWQARYVAARRVITAEIMPKFSDEVVAAARAKVSTEALYLPPEEQI